MIKYVIKILVVITICLLIIPTVTSTKNIKTSEQEIKKVTIRIAQYPRYSGCDTTVQIMFNYAWISNNTLFSFNITELSLEEIKGNGNNPLNNDNFDILYVGASFDSCIKDGKDPELRENIRNFVKNGGGYLGSCAGATFASQGYEGTKFYEKIINNNVLKMVNVYGNDGFLEELQYVFKCSADTNPITGPSEGAQGLVPLECIVIKNNSNPIFSVYPNKILNITYGGGPGLYPANINDEDMGDVVPLLQITEELMETKPIYWYRKGILPGYVPVKKVKTDLLGNYCSVASTYGDGRIVIFGAHPEISPILDGYIHQFVKKSIPYGFKNDIKRVWYSYVGNYTNISYNWWIYRRAAAWVYGIQESDLPPYHELSVLINKPISYYPLIYFNDNILAHYYLGMWNINYNTIQPYLNIPFLSKTVFGQKIGNKIIQKSIFDDYLKTVIIGDITVDVHSEGCKYVEFYLDNQLVFTNISGKTENGEIKFKYKIDKNNFNGLHNLKVIGYDIFDNYVWDESDYVFFNS